MFESKSKLHGFLRNVAETTKEGGYFVGTTYDGMEVFKLLKSKQIKKGESISYSADNQPDDTIWQVTKQYDKEDFIPDDSCLGYKIDVYQDSINKVFSEYLIHYPYFKRRMEENGFEEVSVGFTSLLFSDLFKQMTHQVKKDRKNNKNARRIINDRARKNVERSRKLHQKARSMDRRSKCFVE